MKSRRPTSRLALTLCVLGLPAVAATLAGPVLSESATILHAPRVASADVGQEQDYSLFSDPRLARSRAVSLRSQYAVALKWSRQASVAGTAEERSHAQRQALLLGRGYNAMADATPPAGREALGLPPCLDVNVLIR